MTNRTAGDVRSLDGPRGGEYFVADLTDGRRLAISRKADDSRVWLGNPADPSSWMGQRGGIGTIDGLLDEWRSRLALDPTVVELYWTLNDLSNERSLARAPTSGLANTPASTARRSSWRRRSVRRTA